jgi:hypothetical protein
MAFDCFAVALALRAANAAAAALSFLVIELERDVGHAAALSFLVIELERDVGHDGIVLAPTAGFTSNKPLDKSSVKPHNELKHVGGTTAFKISLPIADDCSTGVESSLDESNLRSARTRAFCSMILDSLADALAFRATNAAAAALSFLVIALVRDTGQNGIVLAPTAGVSGVTCNKPPETSIIKSET